MKKETLHPLDIWLLENNISLPAFAAAHHLGMRTLYEHVNGEVKNPGVLSLQAIEKATGGDVSIAKQIAWFKGRKK